jgi:hypothetical protein
MGRDLSPGNTESGGQRKNGKTRKGNRWLRATLAQSGWAGAAKKNSSFRERYYRLKARRGPQRAVTAVGHAQRIALYWVLRHGKPYQEQVCQMEERRRQSLIRHHLQRLNDLGYTQA